MSISDCLIQEFGYSESKAVELLAEYPGISWAKFVTLRKHDVDGASILKNWQLLRRHSEKGTDIYIDLIYSSHETITKVVTMQKSHT